MEKELKNVEFLIRDLKADNYNNAFIKSLEHLIKSYKELEEKYMLEKTAKEEVEELLENSIPKTSIKEIRDKAEVMDYYSLLDVIDDLNNLLGDDE